MNGSPINDNIASADAAAAEGTPYKALVLQLGVESKQHIVLLPKCFRAGRMLSVENE